jgi:SPOR domain
MMGGKRLAGIVVGVWLASGGLALAQEAAAYPASLEREALLSWLRRETDILPDRVVAVTPQVLTSVVSTFPASGADGPRLVLRTEALSAETFARTGVLSWHVSLSADCQTRRVKLGETTGYAARNLLGDRKPLREADGDWRSAEPGTALDAGWRAACEAGFKGPFQGADVKIARAETGKSPSAAPAAALRNRTPVLTSPPPRAGAAVVQVGASASEAEAQALLTALGDRVGDRAAWIETAQVGGKTWRRAVVGGFADTTEAARFCAELKAAGRNCFVRRAGPG